MLKATIYISILIATMMLAATDALAKDEIYRWVDENGVVHFDEQPGKNEDAVQVKVRKSPSSGVGINQSSASTDAEQPAEPEPSYAQQRRNARAEKRQEAAEQRAEIERTCELARQRVATLEPSPRVIIENEDGSISRLDDEKRLEFLTEAKAYIAENCNS